MTTPQPRDRERIKSAHLLALLGLQSARYSVDAEFAKAVDRVLEWTLPDVGKALTEEASQ